MSTKKKIIFAMGDREVSYYCLKQLIKENNLPVLFIFPKLKKTNFICKVKEEYPEIKFIEGLSFRNEKNLKIIKELEPDYIISILFPYIFKPPIFDYVKIGILNLHPAYLPYNQGWHCPSWCIIENTPIGVTFHWIDDGIDTGNICFQEKLEILPEYTADIIYKELSLIEKKLFDKALPFILNATLPSIKQEGQGTYHSKKDLSDIQYLDLNKYDTPKNLYNLIRGLTTNNINEGAYYIKNYKKNMLNIEISEINNIENRLELEFDKYDQIKNILNKFDSNYYFKVNDKCYDIKINTTIVNDDRILNGKDLSDRILKDLKENIEKSDKKPGLGLIIVGSRKDSMTYVKMKKKACENVGIESTIVELPENINQEDLIKEVNKMNDNESINGILVQLPLPKHIDENKVLLTIKAEKDVDGFHPMNVGNLVLNKNDTIIACTPKGCIKILEENNIEIEGKHAVIIGRSNIVGKPLALLLLNKNATVSICHSKTNNIEEITKQADILLVACGKAQFVKKEWIKEGCIIIDVGINFIDDNTRKSGKRLVGDVDFDDVISKVKAITPVPGGVGPMTIAMLLQNTFELYNKNN